MSMLDERTKSIFCLHCDASTFSELSVHSSESDEIRLSEFEMKLSVEESLSSNRSLFDGIGFSSKNTIIHKPTAKTY